MKKNLIALVSFLVFLLSTVTVWAEDQGTGIQVNTVSFANKTYDDNWVTLTGNIVKQTGKDSYLLKDPTGTITVIIDSVEWGGVEVTPYQPISITGQVKIRGDSRVVEVQSLEEVQPSEPAQDGGFDDTQILPDGR